MALDDVQVPDVVGRVPVDPGSDWCRVVDMGRRGGPMTDLILGPVIAAADAIGRGAWDWWIVAGLVVAVLVAQVVAVVTRGPLGKEGDSDE